MAGYLTLLRSNKICNLEKLKVVVCAVLIQDVYAIGALNFATMRRFFPSFKIPNCIL